MTPEDRFVKKLNKMFAPEPPKVEVTKCRFCGKPLAKGKISPKTFCDWNCVEQFDNLLTEKIRLRGELEERFHGRKYLDAKETKIAMRIRSDIEEIDNFRNRNK